MFKKTSALFLITILLSGCGAKFVYNNLSMITPWYVDDFVDLTREQEKQYQAHLKVIHQWHRQHELPEYHGLLTELLAHLENDQLDRAFMSDHLLALRQRWQVLIDQASPALSEMASGLSDQQVADMMAALEEANKERLKEQDTPAEHAKDVVKGIKRWMGTLSKDQQAMVEAFAEAHPDRSEITVAAHRAFQQQLGVVLENRAEDGFDARFKALIADPLATPAGEVLIDARMAAMEDRITLYQALWQSASDTQRDKVKRRLTDVIEDIEALMVKQG